MQVRRRSRLPSFCHTSFFLPCYVVTLVKCRVNALEKLRIHLFDNPVCKYPKKSYEQLTELSTHIWCKESLWKADPDWNVSAHSKHIQFFAYSPISKYEKSKADVFASWAACHSCMFLCSVVLELALPARIHAVPSKKLTYGLAIRLFVVFENTFNIMCTLSAESRSHLFKFIEGRGQYIAVF